MTAVYNEHCRDCPRLAAFLDQVKAKHPTYFCKPVPPFGSDQAALLVVGLAPGLHGANATGRPFTGDWCSDLLYGTLHAYGFAKKPRSIAADDDQALINCRLTNAVKCLPPENKPTPLEVNTCLRYLKNEILLIKPKVIVALGAVAHNAVLSCLSAEDKTIRRSAFKFAHGAVHQCGPYRLIDSYHPSRYNTNTGRLTPEMFRAVFAKVREYV
ncbi:MAG: uracil-DNA glycosylase [Burkholderiaceae bacterium]|nr:uracil-DNA glycosylase [Burkholderiaceae bacterium]